MNHADIRAHYSLVAALAAVVALIGPSTVMAQPETELAIEVQSVDEFGRVDLSVTGASPDAQVWVEEVGAGCETDASGACLVRSVWMDGGSGSGTEAVQFSVADLGGVLGSPTIVEVAAPALLPTVRLWAARDPSAGGLALMPLNMGPPTGTVSCRCASGSGSCTARYNSARHAISVVANDCTTDANLISYASSTERNAPVQTLSVDRSEFDVCQLIPSVAGTRLFVGAREQNIRLTTAGVGCSTPPQRGAGVPAAVRIVQPTQSGADRVVEVPTSWSGGQGVRLQVFTDRAADALATIDLDAPYQVYLVDGDVSVARIQIVADPWRPTVEELRHEYPADLAYAAIPAPYGIEGSGDALALLVSSPSEGESGEHWSNTVPHNNVRFATDGPSAVTNVRWMLSGENGVTIASSGADLPSEGGFDPRQELQLLSETSAASESDVRIFPGTAAGSALSVGAAEDSVLFALSIGEGTASPYVPLDVGSWSEVVCFRSGHGFEDNRDGWTAWRASGRQAGVSARSRAGLATSIAVRRSAIENGRCYVLVDPPDASYDHAGHYGAQRVEVRVSVSARPSESAGAGDAAVSCSRTIAPSNAGQYEPFACQISPGMLDGDKKDHYLQVRVTSVDPDENRVVRAGAVTANPNSARSFVVHARAVERLAILGRQRSTDRAVGARGFRYFATVPAIALAMRVPARARDLGDSSAPRRIQVTGPTLGFHLGLEPWDYTRGERRTPFRILTGLHWPDIGDTPTDISYVLGTSISFPFENSDRTVSTVNEIALGVFWEYDLSDDGTFGELSRAMFSISIPIATLRSSRPDAAAAGTASEGSGE